MPLALLSSVQTATLAAARRTRPPALGEPAPPVSPADPPADAGAGAEERITA
jgi:hypothetical protein